MIKMIRFKRIKFLIILLIVTSSCKGKNSTDENVIENNTFTDYINRFNSIEPPVSFDINENILSQESISENFLVHYVCKDTIKGCLSTRYDYKYGFVINKALNNNDFIVLIGKIDKEDQGGLGSIEYILYSYNEDGNIISIQTLGKILEDYRIKLEIYKEEIIASTVKFIPSKVNERWVITKAEIVPKIYKVNYNGEIVFEKLGQKSIREIIWDQQINDYRIK